MNYPLKKGGFANATPYETKSDEGNGAALPAEIKAKFEAF